MLAMTVDPWILSFSLITVLATIYMGFWSARRSKTASDFFVAGRSVSVGWNASAISGEYLSAASFMGVAGMVMSSGYDALWYPVCYACGYLFLLLFIAGPLRRFGAYTIPDFAEGRFDSPIFRKVAIVFVLFIGFFYTMPQMKGAGTTLAYIFPGLPYWAGVVLVGAVITLNVALGGMKGITLVQAFQYWAKMFAISVPIFVLMAVYGHYGKQLQQNSAPIIGKGLTLLTLRQGLEKSFGTNNPPPNSVAEVLKIYASSNSSLFMVDLSLADDWKKQIRGKSLLTDTSLAGRHPIELKEILDSAGIGLLKGNNELVALRKDFLPEALELHKRGGLRAQANFNVPNRMGFLYAGPTRSATNTSPAKDIVQEAKHQIQEWQQFAKTGPRTFVEQPNQIGFYLAMIGSYSGIPVRWDPALFSPRFTDDNYNLTLGVTNASSRKDVARQYRAALESRGIFFLDTADGVLAGPQERAAEIKAVYEKEGTYAFDDNSRLSRKPLPDKAPKDESWLNPFGPLTTKAAKAAAATLPASEQAAYLDKHQKPFSLLYTYSLIIALVCGTAGLPHILVRFYTNPDGVAAKRTTMWVMILIGIFYVFPPVFGVMGRNLFPELYAGVGAKSTPQDRMRMFKWCAVLIGVVAVVLGMQVEPLQINFMVGQAFAIAAASYFPLLFMSAWWRGMTKKGAATGMLAGGLLALVGISLTSFSDLKWDDLTAFWAALPLLRILCEQPAIWAVPLAISLMVIVSKLTSREIPADIRMKMLVLHAPEKLGLKQEYIQEHQQVH